MRDLSRRRFNSNNPQANYIKIQERIDSLEHRLRELDQLIIEGMSRISELEGVSASN